MYDVAIIGSGPAGISAVINAKIRNLNYVWCGKSLSTVAAKAELIKNYPGMPDISGVELVKAYEEHINSMEITRLEETVRNIYNLGDYFMILAGNEVLESKTIILCTGAPVANAIKGEEEFLGRGVSYCATCDGGFYRGKKVVVYCETENFTSDIDYLKDMAAEVYVVTKTKKEKLTGILGGDKVEKVTVSKEGQVSEIETDGVFILRENISAQSLIAGIECDKGYIEVNKHCMTNIPGCFAAGDCTGRPYQYAKAIGEGNVALHSAVEYLS